MSDFNDILDDLGAEPQPNQPLSPRARQILILLKPMHIATEVGVGLHLARATYQLIQNPYWLFSSYGFNMATTAILFIIALNSRALAMETYDLRNVDKNWPILRQRLTLMLQIGLVGSAIGFIFNLVGQEAVEQLFDFAF